MDKLRVLSIFGTRPEAVKMAPVVKALREIPNIDPLVCVTAQHRQMLDQVLNLFSIVPNIDLDLMRPNQTLADLTAAVFTELDPVLSNLRPDWVLIQGDTTTAMATALLAFYHQIRVGHVEAGLRTGDKLQPFPEEINRRVAGVIADLHFAPTAWARGNLMCEGVPADQILVTGNTVIDALLSVANMPAPLQVIELLQELGIHTSTPFASGNQGDQPRLIVVTAHRRENFGEPLVNICLALLKLVEIYGDQLKIVYPVHLNPNVQEPVYRILGGVQNIKLLPPMDYLPFVHLVKHATLLLTDSGGLQEEAPGLGVPVLVLREVTERPEGVEAGTVRIVGTQTERIIENTRRLLDDRSAYAEMAQAVNPYGDGHAADRIVRAILEYSRG